MSIVRYGVEGATDVPFVEKLIHAVGQEPARMLVAGGSAKLDEALRRWNKSTNRVPILVLRDWDRRDQVACASALVRKLLGGSSKAPGLALRVPVRSVEAWLLADEAAQTYFGLSSIPARPDDLDDPKGHLVDLCRRSRQRAIREGMVPTARSGRRVGVQFEALVATFGRDHWDPHRARVRSPSLDRALCRLVGLVSDGVW
jgi:hypothetical protein